MILKLTHCENPYEVIANYISNHSKVIEDMIAVIEIDGDRRNELLEYDFDNDSFMFLSDWWEGEQEIALIDYFPVSEACNPKASMSIILLELIVWLRQKQNECTNDDFKWTYDEMIELINEWERKKQNENKI